MALKKVSRATKAGKEGQVIICPLCQKESTVFHFGWYSLACPNCKASVKKTDWFIKEKEE